MFSKIQPKQIQLHDFSSPSGHINFSVGDDAVTADLSASLTGNFDIVGSLLINGVEVASREWVSGENFSPSNLVYTTGDQNILGVKNFLEKPTFLGNLAATESFVSGQITSFLTGNVTISGNKTFVNSITVTGSPVATQSWVSSMQPNAALTVMTTGNQIISGLKTFATNPTVTGDPLATQSWVNDNMATVDNVVFTTGNQTVAGVKTFSSTPVVTGSNVATESWSDQRYIRSQDSGISGASVVTNIIKITTDGYNELPPEALDSGVLFITFD